MHRPRAASEWVQEKELERPRTSATFVSRRCLFAFSYAWHCDVCLLSVSRSLLTHGHIASREHHFRARETFSLFCSVRSPLLLLLDISPFSRRRLIRPVGVPNVLALRALPTVFFRCRDLDGRERGRRERFSIGAGVWEELVHEMYETASAREKNGSLFRRNLVPRVYRIISPRVYYSLIWRRPVVDRSCHSYQ